MSDFITVSSFSFSELEDQLNEARDRVSVAQRPSLIPILTPPPTIYIDTVPSPIPIPDGPKGQTQSHGALRKNNFLIPLRKAVASLAKIIIHLPGIGTM